MDLIEQLQEIGKRAETQREHLRTEEATKNSLVLPFISALGYDVFNPREVIPEFTADIGIKKGEKVDYAVMVDGRPMMLIECKTINCDLDDAHLSQLFRYFHTTDARFGVLTNGAEYRFFTDLDAPNRMDERPFFEFTLANVRDRHVRELKKFSKERFDLDAILSSASDLKYMKGIKRIFAEEWINPSEDLVKLLAGRVYSGRFTQAVREQFTDICKRAFHEFVNDRINERLKSALETDEPRGEHDMTPEDSGNDIETTDEEIEGFQIIRAILSQTMDARRVFMRDTLSYCGVLLDDNNRKPVCRLHFNGSKKYLGLFDEAKNQQKVLIEHVTDIYNFSDRIVATAAFYDTK